MEGIYFESSATTPYHFLTVEPSAREQPSNPVRGLAYGTPADDFDLGVQAPADARRALLHALDDGSEAKAGASNPTCSSSRRSPDLDDRRPEGLEDLQGVPGRDSAARRRAARTSRSSRSCTAASTRSAGTSRRPTRRRGAASSAVGVHGRAVVVQPRQLDKAFAASGPSDWKHIDARPLADTHADARSTPAQVSRRPARPRLDLVPRRPRSASRCGAGVVLPELEGDGAEGPYRLAPNFMVVVPTRTT